MPRPRSEGKKTKRPIVQYTHDNETRVNNPPVGLVDAESDADICEKPQQVLDLLQS